QISDMNYSQFDKLSFRSDCATPRKEQTTGAFSDESSLRSAEYEDIEDRDLARALKRIEKLSEEIRANDDVAAYAYGLKNRIDMSRKKAALTISTLNEKMDMMEQMWDDRIIAEQKSIAKEVLTILKDLKEGELSTALTWKKKGGGGSTRSVSSNRSRSGSSVSSVKSSSMSKKIAHLEEGDKQFAAKSIEVKKDAKRLAGIG
ncbi:hypothetical protein PFISCL1PPCAC_20709, partial [Pristionchus fissidentatus]